MRNWKISDKRRRIIAYALVALAIGAGVAPAIAQASQNPIEETQSQSGGEPNRGGPNSGGKEDATNEAWLAEEEKVRGEAEHAEFQDLMEQAYRTEEEIEEAEEKGKKRPVDSVETEQDK